MNPNDLLTLAKAMGRPYEWREEVQKANVVRVTFEPHKDPSQCMEVLEWLNHRRNVHLSAMDDDIVHVSIGRALLLTEGRSLPEAITLAAIQLAKHMEEK